jgi:hypothetical protein
MDEGRGGLVGRSDTKGLESALNLTGTGTPESFGPTFGGPREQSL